MTIEEFDFEQYQKDIEEACPLLNSKMGHHQTVELNNGEKLLEISINASIVFAVDSIPYAIAEKMIKTKKYEDYDSELLNQATKVLFNIISETDEARIFSKLYK